MRYYYAVASLPKDSWISSYEQALRYVNVNLTFNKIFSSEEEAHRGASKCIDDDRADDAHAIVYTIEGVLNVQNPNKFDRINNIHQAEVIYNTDCLSFTENTLLKELKSWMDEQERVNPRGYLGKAEANKLTCALTNISFYYSNEAWDDNFGLYISTPEGAPFVSVYQKYQALRYKQKSFTFEYEQTPWNQAYFSQRKDFLGTFNQLKTKSDKMKARQDAPNQALQTHLDEFLDKISLIDVMSYHVPADMYWLRQDNRDALGILPALTQAMRLIDSHLDEPISEKEFKKQVQALKKKALILQSSTADTFEYLSYLMLAISACAIALTLASVAAPVTGLAVAGGSALLGLTFFTSSYFPPEPGAQAVANMNALSQDIAASAPAPAPAPNN